MNTKAPAIGFIIATLLAAASPQFPKMLHRFQSKQNKPKRWSIKLRR